jgi:phospholipid/cholesterol/gamma-HCH transport system permease protein
MVRPWTLFDAVGTAVIAMTSYVVEIATLLGFGVASLLTPGGTRSVTRMVLRRQILFTGIQAVPFIAFIALLTAASLVVQTQVRFAGLGTSDLFGQLLVIVVIREVGPLIVALVVIARSGTAIATEIGNMQINRELRGLEQAAIDPFSYLVVPRLGGCCIATICLTLLYIAFSLAGGLLLTHAFGISGAPDAGQFIAIIAHNLTPNDLLIVVAKTIVPGLLIAAIACREGLATGTSITAVPRATTRGVVRAIAAVFCWDALITVIGSTV